MVTPRHSLHGFPCRIAWALLAFGLSTGSATGDSPATISLSAHLDGLLRQGAMIEFDSADFPPPLKGGWFAIGQGNESGIFSLNETTGALSIERPELLSAQSQWELTIEHGNLLAREGEGMPAKFRFLQAAGLSDREICRELGFVTRYVVTVAIKPKTQAPAFPERAWHFLWPSDQDAIGTVQAQDPGDEIQYWLIEQVPSALVEVDSRSGVLWLSNAKAVVDTSNLMWRGTVEARDSSGQKSTATVWITPPGSFPSLGLSGWEIAWPRDQFQRFAGMANDRMQVLLTKADTWRTDLSQFASPSPAIAAKPSADFSTGNFSTHPELSQTLHQESNPLSHAEPPVEVAGVASERSQNGSAVPKAGADWASWALDILKVVLAIFAFVYYRKRTTRERNNSPSEALGWADEGQIESQSEQAQIGNLTDGIDETKVPVKGVNKSKHSTDVSTSISQDVWKDQADEEDLGGEVRPEGLENFASFPGHAVPAHPSTDVPDQYGRLSLDFEHGGSSDPLVPSFSSQKTLSPAAELVEESAEREASLAQLLATEEVVQAEPNPDVISAPSQNELDTLLTMLNQKYSILRPPGAEPVSPPELKEVKTQHPVAPPKPESDSTDSISDYMNNLLAKYSNKSAPKSEVAPPVSSVSIEKPAPPPASSQPIRKSRSLEPGAIPKPVHTYDAKTTRTQMELLRETSNLTAALAIRTASARRRRQTLVRLLMLSAAAAVIYAIILVVR